MSGPSLPVDCSVSWTVRLRLTGCLAAAQQRPETLCAVQLDASLTPASPCRLPPAATTPGHPGSKIRCSTLNCSQTAPCGATCWHTAQSAGQKSSRPPCWCAQGCALQSCGAGAPHSVLTLSQHVSHLQYGVLCLQRDFPGQPTLDLLQLQLASRRLHSEAAIKSALPQIRSQFETLEADVGGFMAELGPANCSSDRCGSVRRAAAASLSERGACHNCCKLQTAERAGFVECLLPDISIFLHGSGSCDKGRGGGWPPARQRYMHGKPPRGTAISKASARHT